MERESTIIYEYEEILLGKKKNFAWAFDCSITEKRKVIGIIWRYAVTHLLHWTPQEAAELMTQEIAKTLKLDKTYVHLDYKYDPKENFDFRYVLKYAFPGEVHFGLKEQTISEYEHVMKIGKWAKSKEPYKFHKNFFLDKDGIDRAAIVLMYAISAQLGYMTKKELYDFFGDKKAAMEWLTEMKIDSNAKIIYDNPLEYFHYSLPFEMQDAFLFHNAYYNQQYNRFSKKIKKKKVK